MKTWRWLVILAPAVLGAGLAFYFFLSFDLDHDHIVYLRADLGSLSLLLGLGLSGLVGLVFALVAFTGRIRQQAYAAAAEERRRFLRRLDHELKNPLTAIRAGLANLAELPSGEARRESLTSVEAQALRLSHLSADLRKLAELEVRLVEHSPVDIPALLREAFSMAQEPEFKHPAGSLAPAKRARRPRPVAAGSPQPAGKRLKVQSPGRYAGTARIRVWRRHRYRSGRYRPGHPGG
jgi:two-component system OmpR family sensor kinase